MYVVTKTVHQISLLQSSATSLTIGWSLKRNDNSSDLNASETCKFQIKITYSDNSEEKLLAANQTSMPLTII